MGCFTQFDELKWPFFKKNHNAPENKFNLIPHFSMSYIYFLKFAEKVDFGNSVVSFY